MTHHTGPWAHKTRKHRAAKGVPIVVVAIGMLIATAGVVLIAGGW